MNTTHWLRRCRAGIALIVGIWAGAAGISHGQATAPLVSLEIRGLSALIQDVNRVAMGLQMGPQGALLSQMLDNVSGGGLLASLDTNGTLRAFVYQKSEGDSAMPGGSPPFVVTLPTQDGGKALLGVMTNLLERGAEEGGITSYRKPGGMPPDMQVGIAQNDVIVGDNRELVRGMLQAFAAGERGPGQRIGVDGTIAVDFNMPALSALMQQALDKAGAAMAGMTPPGGAGENDPAAMMKAQGDFFRQVLGQIDAMHVGLGTDPKNVVIHSRLAAKPGSAIAKLYEGGRPPRPDFMGILPTEGMLFSQVGFFGDMGPFMEIYRDFAEQVFSSMGGGGAGFAQLITDSMADMQAAGTGDYAVSFGIAPGGAGMRYVACYGIKDMERAKALVARYTTGLEELGNVPGLTQKVEAAGTREHGGVSISRYAYQAKFDETLMAGTQLPAFLNAMSNMIYEVAYVGDRLVATVGGDALMDGTLDRLQTPATALTAQEPFRSMFAGDPAVAQATSVGTISLLDYMKFILSMMPGVEASTMDMIPASGSGLAGYSLTKGNSQVGVAKLGIAEIAAIKSMAPFLMMSAMSARGPGRGPGGGMSPMDEDFEDSTESEPESYDAEISPPDQFPAEIVK